MKTASWYQPHTYRIFQGYPGQCVVIERNGAGQRVRETPMARSKADEFIETCKTERAKLFGALIED